MSTTINAAYNDYALGIDNTYLGQYQSSQVNNNESVFTDDETKAKKEGSEKAEAKNTQKKEPSRVWSLFKGAFNFFKGMFTDENGNFSIGQTLKTVGIGVLVAGASILIPGAGTAIAIAGLGFAAKHGLEAGVQIYNAQTADEIDAAYENMGSALSEGALAYVGAKATGAGKTIKNGYKTVKTAGSDLATSYKAGGLNSLKLTAKAQRKIAWNSIKNRTTATWEGTKTNWENMTKPEARYEAKMKSFEEQIDRAKTTKDKNQLRAQRDAYSNGYKKIKEANTIEDAQKAVETLRTEMEQAQKASTRTNASQAARNKYQEATNAYEAAERALNQRIHNGDFKKGGQRAVKSAENAEAEALKAWTDAQNKLGELSSKKGTTQKDLKAAQDAVDKAYQNYLETIQQTAAKKGGSSISGHQIRYRLGQAISEGSTKGSTYWMTLTMAGKGVQNEEQENIEYVA